MGLLYWALFGLLVGAIAKWVMPGDEPGGWLKTMLLGIGGAWVGGFLGRAFGLGTITGFNLGSVALAVAGAMVVIWVSRKLRSD